MAYERLNSETSAARSSTASLLRCGVLAGPLFLAIFAIQLILRPDFHFTRTEPSLLSLGPLGWIQITNFILGGLLVIAGALGIRRMLRASKGGLMAPLFLMIFSAGQIGAGIFLVDPPPSNPPVSIHGMLHVVCGVISFLALMLASFVFVRVFLALKLRAWALLCAFVGLLLITSFLSAGAAQQSGANIQFFLNSVWTFEWLAISLIAARLLKNCIRPEVA